MKNRNNQILPKYIIKPIFLLMFWLLCNNMYAQPSTLYFMDKVHQSDNLNPATQNCCNGFYSLPVLSGLDLNLVNSGFDYNDLIHLGKGDMADSLVIDLENIKSKLGKKNYFLTDIDLPLFGFGFRSGSSFISFEVSNKTKMNFAYPKNLIALSNGNAEFIGVDNPAIIENFGPSVINYYEFAFGWSRKITKKLTLGAKLKVLSGVFAITQKHSDLKLTTADTTFAMSLETDLNYNISAPLEFSYDENGQISDFSYDESNMVQDITPGKNFGTAIDFGAIYQLTDKFKLYASVTDLGFIRWSKNSTNLSQKGVFDFSGLTLDSVFTESNYNEFSAIGDSLTNFIHFDHADKKFTTILNTSIYFGGTFEIATFFNLGLLSRTVLYNKSLHQGFTFSANFKPGKNFSTTVSYSAMNREYKNIGLGMSLRFGPMQFYLVSDNIYTAFKPKNSKAVNLMFGLNMVFGCNKQDNLTMLNNNHPDSEEGLW